MKISPRDGWIIARLLCGRGTAPLVESDRIRPLADRLRDTEPSHRGATWKGFLTGRPDREDWSGPVGDADPAAPPPEEESASVGGRPRANLDDLKRMAADTSWPWPGWLAGGVLNALAADPGVGKTILAMNLARVLWEGRPWPDGQKNPSAAGTKTLWVPGDRHYPQLIELADRYGLPGEALLFNAPADDPTTGLDLDDGETLDDLEEAIRAESPGLVIVDTVGMTTERNLGRPEEARAYFGPLMAIAGDTRVSFLRLTHLSREAQALGRRIVGAARVVWKLTCPDPDGQPDRRKLWVDKSYSVIPKPLGMTIADDGCTFDHKPPGDEAEKKGRPAKRQEECKSWLEERLTPGPAPAREIIEEARALGYGMGLLYKARAALGIEELERQRKRAWSLPDDQERKSSMDSESKLPFPDPAIP
jgi:hypothetical protein